MKILEENKELYGLIEQEGDKLLEASIETLFPDISDQVRLLIENDDVIKKEMMVWIKSEVLGSQYNAIRYCCVPDDDTSNTQKTFSNDFCESYKVCPFYRQNIAPEGDLCPLESLQVKKLTSELVNELEIDIMEDYTDKVLIGEIIMFSLLENRAVRGLACMNLGFSNVTQGKNGKEYSRQKNFYLDVIKDMQAIKNKLRTSLVATREEKIKLKQAKVSSTGKDIFSETLAKIKGQKSNIGLIIDAEEIDDNTGE